MDASCAYTIKVNEIQVNCCDVTLIGRPGEGARGVLDSAISTHNDEPVSDKPLSCTNYDVEKTHFEVL